MRPVDPEKGIWDLYLPEDLVQELEKQEERGFRFEAADRYFRIRFLDEDK